MNPDAILGVTALVVGPLRRLTSTVPIVFINTQIGMLNSIESVAPSFPVKIVPLEARQSIEHAIDAFLQEDTGGGLLVLPNPVVDSRRDAIIATAARAKLPAIYPFRYFVTSGGLMSYGVNTAAQSKDAASYIDRILRGAKAGDLPVQAPTKFELVINLKTAKALGLTVPPSLLSRADEVLE